MKNLKTLLLKYYKFILVLIFVVSIFLRVQFLDQKALTFGYDQARDAINAREITSGDLKIQGPPSSAPGLYHGVLYYYVLAPAYLIGGGSPIFTAYYLSIVNSITVFIVFLIAKKFTNNINLSLLSSFLYSISFESTQYATWMSNPTIAIVTVPLMYLGVSIWISNKNQTLGSIIAAIGLGLSVQSEIFLAYHIVPLIIFVFSSKKSIAKKTYFYFVTLFLISVSSLIVSELKFGFGALDAIKSLASGDSQNLAYAKSVGDYLNLYLNQVGRVFAFNTYPGNIGYGGIFVIVLCIYSILNFKKNVYPAFLSIWALSHLSVVTVGGTSTPFLMVGIGPAVSLILAYYIFNLFKSYKLASTFILIVVMYGNISFIYSQNKLGATLFSIQKGMTISNQINVITYTYDSSFGNNFSINTLTSPLWINIVWSYLYKWYGFKNYGYLPSWHGKDQIGQIDSLSHVKKPQDISYLIIEPMDGIPNKYLTETIQDENSVSVLLEEKKFGEIRVQKRKKIR